MEEYIYESFETGEVFTKEEMLVDMKKNHPGLDCTDSRVVLMYYRQIEKGVN